MPTVDFHERLKENIQRKTDPRFDRIERRRAFPHSGAAGLALSSLIVLVGLGLLLDNMGIVELHDLLKYWPLFLIAYGASRIVGNRGTSSIVWGGEVALIGALLLLDTLNIVRIDFDYVWPLAIIAFGLSMLVRAIDRKHHTDDGTAPLAMSEFRT